MGVHRRVDIYSIESAGIEYSIDMKVNWYESYLQVAPTQVLSIPRLVFQCKSLGQTLGKQISQSTFYYVAIFWWIIQLERETIILIVNKDIEGMDKNDC